MMIEGDGYGFFRGAVVMSASALESNLRSPSDQQVWNALNAARDATGIVQSVGR